MDKCRFDNWTRMIARQADRRSAVKGLAGGAAALAMLVRAELGFAQDEVLLQAGCGDNGSECRNPGDCCSNQCKKRKNDKRGKCQCARADQSCQRDAGCCSGKCDNSSKKCTCEEKGKPCGTDADCCSDICDRNKKCACIKNKDRCNSGDQCCSGKCRSGFCKK